MKNVQLGRDVLNFITTHRDQFDMYTWGEVQPPCGTIACLAGWTMLRAGYQLTDNEFWRPDGSAVPDNGGEAAELLGLTDDEVGGRDENDNPYLFAAQNGDEAISRFRELVEGAEEDVLDEMGRMI